MKEKTQKKAKVSPLATVMYLIHKSWEQVSKAGTEIPNQMSSEQIRAYTTAMCTISKIEEELYNYLCTDEEKISPINFDRNGLML